MDDSQKLFSRIADSSADTEFYTPVPEGYQPGRCRYVVVVGTVMSGLGKGIFSSSLAKLLQDKGLKVSPIKLEGYLNIDSGTLNPYRHGEVFVLDDGMECDMDLGTYERMLDQDLTRANFATSGQIFTRVLDKERQGLYLGRDVQWIPHVTGEVKCRLRELAVSSGADVVFVEIGGTVGDYENAYFIEALRQMGYEEGPSSICWVALTYVLEPPSLGEQKSKAAQLGIKSLNAMGVHPHIIACRAESPVTDKVRQKLALYGNVPMERVFSMHDCDSVYLVPEMLRGAGLDTEVIKLLSLSDRVDEQHERLARQRWRRFVDRIGKAQSSVVIGITGKYTALRDSYASIIQALEHAGVHLGVKVQIRWIDTRTSESTVKELEGVHGIIVPGGFGIRGMEGKIAAARYARENKIPYLGICLGFQAAVIEFARNVAGIEQANSSEVDPECKTAVITILPEQRKVKALGATMRLGGHDVKIKPGTIAWELFGRTGTVRMRFRHRYEVDPDYIDALQAAGMVFSGRAPHKQIMQILELPSEAHPYFIATQAHPELTSRPLKPQAMFVGLVAAARAKAHPHQPWPSPVQAASEIRRALEPAEKP